MAAKASQQKLEGILSSNQGSAGPKPLPLEREDVAALHVPLPLAAASFSGPLVDSNPTAEQAPVSSNASPAALQQALRQFGEVVPSMPSADAEPLPADDDTSPKEPEDKPAIRKTRHGEVTGIDRRSGSILLAFPGDSLPEVGSRVRVHQRLLFKTIVRGEFEVVGINGKTVIAKPLGDIDLEQIRPADEAVAF